MSSTTKDNRRRVVRRAPAGPYAQAAPQYLLAGWSPLPLPAKAKKKPPEGFTGRGNPMATVSDVERWIGEEPGGNICLRMPPGVAGIDVDAWKGAGEKESWLELVARYGPLPDAPRSTSRSDPDSGIWFFRVPEGVILRDLPAGTNGVKPGEVLQNHHRYAVVWPSIHPDTGRTYLWDDGVVPNVSELPWLPDAWIEVLTAATRKPVRREGAQVAKDAYVSDTDWPSVYRQMSSDRLKQKLGAWLRELQTAGESHRTDRLFAIASRIGSVVASGRIPVRWAVDSLYDACQANGYFRKYEVSEWSRHVDNAFRLAGVQW